MRYNGKEAAYSITMKFVEALQYESVIKEEFIITVLRLDTQLGTYV